MSFLLHGLSRSFSIFIRLARFHRPAGIFLVLLPCWWGVALAGNSLSFAQTIRLLVQFTIGATVMRGAGCIINDLADCEIDRQVTRTKSRPLANGEVTPFQAVVLFGILCCGGLAVLLALPPRCWPVAPLALGLAGIYPYMKRFTHWPQLVLGLAFNIGVFFGAMAVMPAAAINWPALFCLYGAGIAWTLGYDTIYAFQDKEDDLKIGVKSTAILFGRYGKTGLCLSYVLMFALIGMTGYLAGGNVLYYSLLVVGALITGLSLQQLDLGNPQDCLRAFGQNVYLGAGIWLVLLCLTH